MFSQVASSLPHLVKLTSVTKVHTARNISMSQFCVGEEEKKKLHERTSFVKLSSSLLGKREQGRDQQKKISRKHCMIIFIPLPKKLLSSKMGGRQTLSCIRDTFREKDEIMHFAAREKFELSFSHCKKIVRSHAKKCFSIINSSLINDFFSLFPLQANVSHCPVQLYQSPARPEVLGPS